MNTFTSVKATSLHRQGCTGVITRKFHSSNYLKKSIGEEVVIVSAARTPVGSIGGSLSSVSTIELGATAIKAALQKAGIEAKQVQEVYMGNVLQANIGQSPARQALIKAGLPENVEATTFNKVCASGMKAVILAAQNIALGHRDIMVAGGMESMSNVPYYVPGARYGYKYGNQQLVDGILKDGLWDAYNDVHMGNCGEKCAKDYKISREDQDKFAIDSYKRAAEAWKNNAFKDEIAPVVISSKKGDITVAEDEEYKKIQFDKVSTLKPAFQKDGTITAANASSLNDGASALVLTSAKKAQELGLKPIARIIGYGDAAQAPIDFPTSPSKAIPIALQKAGLKISDIDYFEINQAFSVVSLANMKILGLDPAKVDIWGGAVALGHPIGSSGSRILVTLTNILRSRNAKYGVAGICNGGGGASAVVIEKL